MNDRARTRSITMEFNLPHSPAKVWRALTEPELLAKWLMSTDMRLAVGQGFTFKRPPTEGWDGVVNCEMKEIELHKRLRYSWASLGLDTVITLDSRPYAGGWHAAAAGAVRLPFRGRKAPVLRGGQDGVAEHGRAALARGIDAGSMSKGRRTSP